MVDPTTVLALGLTLLFISIYNFYWVEKVIKSYLPKDNKDDPEKRRIKLFTKIPLDMLQKIQSIVLFSIPMIFFSLFMILFAVNA